ncbi:MAG TPA: DUF998 domain-containing protein, partial [Nakamurella multipartita]|nr:DUF998 domain-containing protein [Nakamurella multipartita]
RPVLWVGFAGAALMAVVRTDEGGGAMSGHAQAHMAGAVVALVFLPLGIVLALRGAPPAVRRLALALTALAAVLGVLVIMSATGLDTAGLGAGGSWALWQGALVVVEMILVTVLAVVADRLPPGRNAVGADG